MYEISIRDYLLEETNNHSSLRASSFRFTVMRECHMFSLSTFFNSAFFAINTIHYSDFNYILQSKFF